MSGTTIPNLPAEPTVDRGDFAISQSGLVTTYKATWSQVLGAMNSGDVTAALGFVPFNDAGGNVSGTTTITSGTFSVTGGAVTLGGATVTGSALTLNGSTGDDHLTFQMAGTNIWDINNSAGVFSITRYSAGVVVDNPISVDVSGNVIMTKASSNSVVSIPGANIVLGDSTTHNALLTMNSTSGGVLLFQPAAALTGSLTITSAAQAGSRVYTMPDRGAAATFMLTNATMAANGLTEQSMPLMWMRTPTGTVMDATGGAGLFSIASSVGTSLHLAGENCKSNTKTDDAIVEYVLPSAYISTKNLTCIVNAQIAGTGTAGGTNTLGVNAYLLSKAGAEGSNLGSSVQAMTTSAADYSFTITGTSLTPGVRVLLEVEAVLQETGGANNINAQINSVRVT